MDMIKNKIDLVHSVDIIYPVHPNILLFIFLKFERYLDRLE